MLSKIVAHFLAKKKRVSLNLAAHFFFARTRVTPILGFWYSGIRIYKTAILPMILYGCETWSLTLREEHRLRVFENRVLRRIFRPKEDEVTGELRKLYKEELHDLYSSPSIIRIIKTRGVTWEGHVARMGEKRNAYRLLMGKPGGRRPLERPRRRWLDNIRMELVEVGWGDVDWIGLAQDRGRWRALVNSVLNLRVP
jgi:hypothetical protein